MKNVSFLVLLAVLCLGFGLVFSCLPGGDDDDDDAADDDSGDGQTDEVGACYIQCEAGCITAGACMSPFDAQAACASWGEEHCQADGCALADYAFVAGCESCDSCDGAPDWYEQ